jgi:hypothetical protein
VVIGASTVAIAEGSADVMTGLGMAMSAWDDLSEGTHEIRDTPNMRSTSGSNSPSEILGEALERAGSRGRRGTNRTTSCSRATPAWSGQQILREAGIGINEAENGVWLPRVARQSTTEATIISDAATAHDTVHTAKYVETVTAPLETASRGGPDAVVRALEEIKMILRGGGTP